MTTIRGPKEYERILLEIERLIRLQPSADSLEGLCLKELAEAVENYERVRYPIDRPSPMERIYFRLDVEVE